MIATTAVVAAPSAKAADATEDPPLGGSVGSADLGRETQGNRIPLRMCLVCREIKPRNLLIRLVRGPGSTKWEPNPDARITGKGAYFCKTEDCLQRLQDEKKLRRLFRDRFKEDCLSWMLRMREQAEQGSEIRPLGV